MMDGSEVIHMLLLGGWNYWNNVALLRKQLVDQQLGRSHPTLIHHKTCRFIRRRDHEPICIDPFEAMFLSAKLQKLRI